MRKLLAFAFLFAWSWPASAGVRCSSTPCIDSAGGVTSPITTDPVSATGAWSFNNAANTPVTFSDGFTAGGLTVTSIGLASFATTGAFALDGLKFQDSGEDNKIALSTQTDASADRNWYLNFGNQDRALAMFGSAATVTIGSHLIFTGTAPTLSACGASPTIVGSDVAGRVVMGTSGPALASCTMTFATAYSAAPKCTISAEVATILTTQALSFTVSTTALTFTGTDLDSAAVHYMCIQAS